MADFEVIPMYKGTMAKVEEEPASAELFNVRFQDMLNNDAFLKQELDGFELVDSKVAVTDSKGQFRADKLDGVLEEIFTKVNEIRENALTQSSYITTIGTTWAGATAPFTQEITINGIKGTDTPVVDVILSNDTTTALLQEKAWVCVSRVTTSDNKIKVYCNKDKPATGVQIQLKVVG